MNRADFAQFHSPVISRRRCTGLGLALFAACATGALNIGLSPEGWSLGPAAAHARGGDNGGGGDNSGHSGGDDNGGDRGGDDNGGDRGGDDNGGHGRGSDDGPGDDHGGGRGGDDGRDGDRGGRGDDDGGRDDNGGRGRGRDDGPGDDRDRHGRGRDDRPSPTGPVGAPGGAVSKVERSAAGFEVEYANGWKVEVENGRFEVKNPAGRTVEQRPATSADIARFRGL